MFCADCREYENVFESQEIKINISHLYTVQQCGIQWFCIQVTFSTGITEYKVSGSAGRYVCLRR